MIRYRLDDLGWYQFEWLVQALLKDHLGIGVESWGGHSDHGRDVWCPSPLHFPTSDEKTAGPFLFQVKFIENANAAGARPVPRLMAAIKAEGTRISQRRFQQKSTSQCEHYVLVTNCLMSPENRHTISAELGKVLPDAQIHFLGASDLCDLLDLNPGLRRSFPQLLSLRDLDVLLTSAVNRDIIERSSAAISYAKDLAPVFVPTAPYIQAWEVLKKHHFVVLEGPPEMGKSAIGWMIALAQIANEWEASVCDTPDDFWRALRPDTPQIFIADDAFGRTEYDASRGAKWETQLHRVFSRLGNTHWLVWTSRKHILERARKHMDIQHAAHAFPAPAEILVDASQLTVQEKAIMLYRHAKRALASAQLRSFVQRHAVEVVKNAAFTPERIRRFVSEAVPQLGGEAPLDSDAISTKISQEIQNPTDRMRKSFHALPLPHKWMLLSLLESGRYCTTEDLLLMYREQYGDAGVKPSEILDEVTEAFIAVKGTTQRYVEWIHPSYRDLVIEQLRDGGSLKSEFLNRMNIAGIKLALSDTGGSAGRLRFPLISCAKDWNTLQRRTLETVRISDVEDCTALFAVLVAALDGSRAQDESALLTILKGTCRVIREKWDADHIVLDAAAISAYATASERTSPMEPMPQLETTWQSALQSLRRQVEDVESDFIFQYSGLDEFLSLVEEIKKSEPRLFRRVNFPETLDGDIEALLARIDQALKDRPYYSEKDEYDSEADASLGLAKSLKRLQEIVPSSLDIVKLRVSTLTLNANRCREKYFELDEEDGERTDYLSIREDHRLRSTEPFDINAVFVDL